MWIRLIINAALAGLFWGLSFYWIRKGMNPEVTDLRKYRQDAIYGSIGAAVTFAVSVVIIRSEVIADSVMTAFRPQEQRPALDTAPREFPEDTLS